MRFDLDSYQTVQERIDLFRSRYPDGRFELQLVHMTENQVVMKASVYTVFDSQFPTCQDFAEETLGSSPVNKTSFVENCATSALGRAISQLGGEFSPTNKKPSREEMEKVARAQVDWMAEADKVLNVTQARELYAKAKAAKAPAEVLDRLKDIGKALSVGSENS